jgi:NitT/TauT family transport system permease protein
MRNLLQLVLFFAFLALWQAVISAHPEWAFFIGSPLGVVEAIRVPETLQRLPYDILLTAIEAAGGFAIGVTLGTTLGLLLWLSRTAFFVIRPYLVFLGALPIFALGPIFAFWFGTGLTSKLALGAVATFSLAAIQAYQGAREIDPNLIRLGVAFGARRFQILRKLVIPSSVVWVLAGARLNIGMAMLAAVVGEFISSQAGLGNLLVLAEGLYNVNLMLACIGALGALAIVFQWLTIPIERRVRRFNPDITAGLLGREPSPPRGVQP